MKRTLKFIQKHHIYIIYKIFKKVLTSLRVFLILKINPNSRAKCTLGASSRVIGIKNIEIVGSFSLGDHFWLEAISEYRDQIFEPYIKIEDNFSASDFVHLACVKKISIGRNVLLGSKVHITDHAHGAYSGEFQSSPDVAPIERILISPGQVIIEDNVWIGDNVVVLPNTTIGSGSIIGANSVVSKSIPKNVIAVGTPAKPIKKWDEIQKKWITI